MGLLVGVPFEKKCNLQGRRYSGSLRTLLNKPFRSRLIPWLTVWKSATGSSARKKPLSTFGTGCNRVIHRTHMNSPLAAAWSGAGGEGDGGGVGVRGPVHEL